MQNSPLSLAACSRKPLSHPKATRLRSSVSEGGWGGVERPPWGGWGWPSTPTYRYRQGLEAVLAEIRTGVASKGKSAGCRDVEEDFDTHSPIVQ